MIVGRQFAVHPGRLENLQTRAVLNRAGKHGRDRLKGIDKRFIRFRSQLDHSHWSPDYASADRRR